MHAGALPCNQPLQTIRRRRRRKVEPSQRREGWLSLAFGNALGLPVPHEVSAAAGDTTLWFPWHARTPMTPPEGRDIAAHNGCEFRGSLQHFGEFV